MRKCFLCTFEIALFFRQGTHKTCPMCRATVRSGQDTWVLSEKPDDAEMANATLGYLMGLVDKHPTTDSDE